MLNKDVLLTSGGSQIPITHTGLIGDGDDRWGIMPYLLGYRESHFEPETISMGGSTFYFRNIYNYGSAGLIKLYSDPGGFVSNGKIYFIRCDTKKGIALPPNPQNGMQIYDWLFKEEETGMTVPLYIEHRTTPPPFSWEDIGV